MDEASGSRFSYLRFTASGSEYFRIWAVNLLLTIVTLGFYLPFAKARRLRYFYANTLVDGQPLAFHGNPWSMFRGYLVMLALFGSYALSSQFWPAASLGVFVVLALLWPALWRSSLIFRMGNTSWRGLRFGFEGSLPRAYAWLLPGLVAAALLGATAMLFTMGVQQVEQALRQARGQDVGWAVALPLLYPLIALALAVAMLSLALWLLKRYQHGGYRIAQEAAQLDAPASVFVSLGLKLLLWAVLLQLLLGLILGFLWPRVLASQIRGDTLLAIGGVVMIAAFVGGFALTFNASIRAWMQNTVWTRTRSQTLRIFSNVSAMELAALGLQNAVLVLLTLGLYRPFAVVNVMRLRLQSVRVEFLGDTEAWQSRLAAAQASGTGEMAGDFFGIDVGL